MVLPPQLTPGDQIPAVGEDFSTVIMQTSGEQYSQRLNEVVDEYVTFGVLREKNT